MATGKHVSYYRVSTAKQGRSGLGLEAQQEAVRSYLNGGSWELLEEFTEVESGKRDTNRPKLQEALRLCKLTGATLIVAKLDRLSRDAAFLLTLQNSGARFVAADMPDANNLTVGIMALVAQQEREAISARTKAALAAAKGRGVVLGGYRGHPLPAGDAARASAKVRSAKAANRANDVYSAIVEARASGATSLRQIAAVLSERRITTPRGGGFWQASQVKAVLDRVEGVKPA
ncbi:recombinase family protein [Sphingomonas jeddahensis]|uniref:DNA-invertase hin n=1 Tax=Sphingomonas jeddahensis TaxID=1915074 RepID=A0A1V2ETR5_9SPHN|nr:recombinase family protein [Sphingomonas jeddahensis]ONF95990.1 DNA-invertase hin [Sphingomonas jeddahensis]